MQVEAVQELAGRGVTPASMRWVVVAPTFNHAAALGFVVRALDERQLPVIVINDGATDPTAEVLAAWLGAAKPDLLREVVTHVENRGKAAALRSGFAEAVRLGFTHAVTIDTDGQHDVDDLQSLMALSVERPGAIIVGARVRGGSAAPLASRIGRVLSNGLVWIESGVSVSDSQSGMRVYPLASMSTLTGRAARYSFETEVLVRAGWHGVPVIETPIRCIYDLPGGRTTHFRLGRDTLGAIGMHVRLLGRALMPGPKDVKSDGGGGWIGAPGSTGTILRRLGQWFSLGRLGRMAQGDAKLQAQLSSSVGAGLLMATLPLYGIKTGGCLLLAWLFRLHPLVVVGVSSLSTPPLGFGFIAASICVGHVLINGSWPVELLTAARGMGGMELLRTVGVDWVIGSLVVGPVLGVLGYLATRAMLARMPRAATRAEALAPISPPRLEPEVEQCEHELRGRLDGGSGETPGAVVPATRV